MSYDRVRVLKMEGRGILGLAVGIISVERTTGGARRDAEKRGSKTSGQGSPCRVQSRFSSLCSLLLHIPHSTSTLLHSSSGTFLFLDFLASRLIVFDLVAMTPPHFLLPWPV
ncbi:hypothetical protein ACMYSQ_003008 [Aspergillus niger]